MNYRTLQSRRFRKLHPDYNKNYTKEWYDQHPGYHAAKMRDLRRRKKEKQMPTGVRISDEQKQAMKTERANGASWEDLAKKYGVGVGAIQRAVRIGPNAEPPKSRGLAPEKLAEIRELLEQGITQKAIAKKVGVHVSTVNKIHIGRTHADTPSASRANGKKRILSVLGSKVGRPSEPNPKRDKVLALRAKGMSMNAIAEKLGIPRTTAYYLYGSGRKRKKSTIPMPNEVNTNGHEQLDTRFLVGFGCAELERTLTAVAQRLGLSPNLLRQGFSRFLGSAQVR